MHEPTGSGTDLIAVGPDAEDVVGQDVGSGDVAIDVVVRSLTILHSALHIWTYVLSPVT